MQQIFVFLNLRTNGQRLRPEHLLALQEFEASIIKDHNVRIIHKSREELKQRRGRYEIEIDGSRIFGRWVLRAGELENLIQQAGSRTS